MSTPSQAESSSQDLSYMLTMPIPQLVAKMAIPTVITMLVTSVYGIADMFFESELGTSASGDASLLRQSLVVVANVLLNIHASAYGDAAVAGISITSRVFLVVISIMFGIGQGFQPVAGFCYGAKQFSRVRQSYYFTLFVSTLIQLLFALLLFFFARHTVQLFQTAQEVVQVGTRAIRFYALSLPFLPLSVVTNMLLQVTGKNKQSIFLSSCRQGIFFLPLIFILPRFFGITGLELSQPLANLLSGLIAIPFLVKVRFTYQDKTY